MAVIALVLAACGGSDSGTRNEIRRLEERVASLERQNARLAKRDAALSDRILRLAQTVLHGDVEANRLAKENRLLRRVHADLTMLARLSQALARARAVPLAA